MQVGKAISNDITVPDRLKTSDSWISDSTTQIKLKKNICTGLTGYSSTFYRNISRFFPKYIILNGNITPFNGSYGVNSIIADFTIHGTTCSDYSLIIKFEHLLIHINMFESCSNLPYARLYQQINCKCDIYTISYRNTVHGAWSKFGSQVVNATESYTICEYNHTTNFAILMSPGRTVICSAIAVGLHFMFLTDFALMLSEGILIVRMVVFVFPTNSISHKLIPACWIVPACIVGITAGLTKLKGYGNQQ
ncbi:Hypothetical predicted protein, partial [Mytilus galloprovincialis]